MDPTPVSLLERLKRAGPDASEWRRLQDVYLPLIRTWLSRVPGLGDEADDFSQETLVVLFRELPSFERRRDGSFRAWLRQIVVHRVWAWAKQRNRRPLAGLGAEAERLLAQLEDPDSDLSRKWDREHDRHVLQKLLAAVQSDFEPRTWQAFTRFALEGCPAEVVARELGMSEGAVVKAKFRVVKRLREEAGELVE